MGLLEGGQTIWGEIFPLDEAKNSVTLSLHYSCIAFICRLTNASSRACF